MVVKRLKTAALLTIFRGGSRAAATSKMERFVIIVNGWKPLTIITKRSILNVAAALDLPLVLAGRRLHTLHMLNELRMDKTEVKVIYHIIDLTKCSRPYKPNEPKVLIKKTTTYLTNPYFISLTVRTYSSSPFSSFNDEKIKVEVLQKANRNS